MFPLLLFTTTLAYVLAYTPGGFEDGGNTLVSAMMMFLGNEHSVYILDKAEGNAAQVVGHSAWGSLWDIKTRKALPMDIKTNSFCASGMHLPNGSFVTFGGNDAVTVGGKVGSLKNPDGNTGAWDAVYQDFDGRRSIRIVNPCKISDSLNTGHCKWYDEPEQLAMKKQRWYSTAEPNGDGRIILIGGMIFGGYINRVLPNVDPATEGGQAEPTYEYFPAKDGDPQVLNFVVKTSGLNAYPHAFLMPSGRMLLQANISTTLWNDSSNTELPLPDMPNGIIRVYPASGATAMLPLTPANNWTPTVLFCGGTVISDDGWGAYAGPNADTWNIVASRDCQRLTPEPLDGSVPAYEQDDDMLEPRTMGQFILLPTGQMLLINGALNGTAGYSNRPTPYELSLAAGPVLTPVLYDPKAPKGSRWSREGLSPSQIPRLYHSTAILLPDGSVLVAGSNPNPDVHITAVYPTEYRADIFYPPYFSASVRPSPLNLPQTLSYGGPSFDIVVPNNSYTGDPNNTADATIVTLVRGGFTTHAMNMGQRFMQLNNTYTVFNNGTIVLHVAQPPPNPNLFQPGPALLYVVMNGVPSIGKQVIIGNGNVGPQPTLAASELPASVKRTGQTTPDPGTTGPQGGNHSASHKTPLIAGLVGGTVLALILCIVVGFIYFKSKKAENSKFRLGLGLRSKSKSESDGGSPELGVLAPLAHEGMSEVENDGGSGAVTPAAGLRPYSDRPTSGVGERSTSQLYSSVDFDPYSELLGSPRRLDSMTNLEPPVLGYISRTDSSQVSSNQPSYPNLPGTIDQSISQEPSSPLSRMDSSQVITDQPSSPNLLEAIEQSTPQELSSPLSQMDSSQVITDQPSSPNLLEAIEQSTPQELLSQMDSSQVSTDQPSSPNLLETIEQSTSQEQSSPPPQ